MENLEFACIAFIQQDLGDRTIYHSVFSWDLNFPKILETIYEDGKLVRLDKKIRYILHTSLVTNGFVPGENLTRAYWTTSGRDIGEIEQDPELRRSYVAPNKLLNQD